MSAVLALDTATRTGFALKADDGEVVAGVWPLGFGPGRPYANRSLNLWAELDRVQDKYLLDLVVTERPIVMPGRESAVRVCFGLIATVEMWCEARHVEYREMQIGHVKKWATGRGNAKKSEMIATAKAKWPGVQIVDDNQADAMHLLDCALGEVGR